MRPYLILPLIALCLLVAACGDNEATRANRRGNEAFQKQQYETALASYETALEAAPAQPQALYNLGNTYYRMEQGESAQRTLESAADVAQTAAVEGNLDAQAWYNLGNVRFAAEDYAGAVDAYKETLRRVPADLDAKVNLELALKKLRENEEPEDEEQPEQTPTPSPTPSPTPQGEPPPEGEATPTPSPQATATPTQAPSATPLPTEPPPGSGAPTPDPNATPSPQPSATSPAGLPSAGSGQLTPEEARRILEAAAGDTQTLQEALQQGITPPSEIVEKDW